MLVENRQFEPKPPLFGVWISPRILASNN